MFVAINLQAQSVPAGARILLRDDALESFRLTSNAESAGAARDDTTPANGTRFARARRIETTRELSPAWAVELRAPLPAVAAGDVALLHLFARSTGANDESGRARVRVVVQEARPDYAKDLESQLSVGREWQEFFLPFAFAHARAGREEEIAFGFGYKRQSVELAGIELLDYGRSLALSALPKTRFTYVGREAGAPWRRDALARIERRRKSDVTVRVLDASGAPVSGATVRIEQRRSAFEWGSALQLARLVSDAPEDRIYREKALQLFNAATPENDLKWPVWNGDRGPRFGHAQSLAALRWLNEHGFHVRGHVLVWPGWKDLPKVVVERRGTPQQGEIPALVLEHIRDITRATRGLVREWDVLNEPYDHHDLMDLFGRDIMVSWFKAAAESVPGVPLYLNDYSNHDRFADPDHVQSFCATVAFLQKAGAPLGGLGLQAHISAQPGDPEHVLATLDRLAEFKLPIRFTEFDVDTDDEQLQADYTRDFLTLAFSHPAVVGVQLWGFGEKTHWRPRAAMFRNDWSEKPNANVYRELVLEQWRTHATGVTDATGRFTVRGFHGDYTVEVRKDGREAARTFVLRADAEPGALDLRLP